MKCVDSTRSSAPIAAAAILVMDIDEVLVARMVSFEHTLASSAKMERLSSRISGTASMTKSTSERAESSVVFVIRERISSASAEVILCLAMSLDRRVSVYL